MKVKTKSYLEKESVFSVLAVEKDNRNQDWINFSRPQKMVIVWASLIVSTNNQPFLPQ